MGVHGLVIFCHCHIKYIQRPSLPPSKVFFNYCLCQLPWPVCPEIKEDYTIFIFDAIISFQSYWNDEFICLPVCIAPSYYPKNIAEFTTLAKNDGIIRFLCPVPSFVPVHPI